MKKETRQTILMLIFALLLMFADSIWENVFGQVFAGPGISNKGAMIQLGVLSNKTELCLSYTLPMIKNTNAKVAALTIGQKFDITQNENDNYSIMPYMGYAYLRWNDFTAYDNDTSGKTAIDNLSEFKPVVGIQLGKDSHAGNVFIYSQYCKTFYVGIGLKVYFNKL